MNILSSQPSVLAKVSAVVDAIVASNVTVEQSALFPLLPFPAVHRPSLVLGSTLVDSTIQDLAGQVANAAASQITIFVLTPGIWEISAVVQYNATYTNAGSFGFNIGLGVPGLGPYLFATRPNTQSSITEFKRVVTLDASRTLWTFLAANTVGQDHSYQCCLSVQRYNL